MNNKCVAKEDGPTKLRIRHPIEVVCLQCKKRKTLKEEKTKDKKLPRAT